MPEQVFAFPFAVGPNGSVATVEHESDDEYQQLIALACMIVPGEVPLAPTFGIDDPAFAGFDMANLARHVQDFGPPVTVEGVKIRPRSDGREEMTVHWTRLESQQ